MNYHFDLSQHPEMLLNSEGGFVEEWYCIPGACHVTIDCTGWTEKLVTCLMGNCESCPQGLPVETIEFSLDRMTWWLPLNTQRASRGKRVCAQCLVNDREVEVGPKKDPPVSNNGCRREWHLVCLHRHQECGWWMSGASWARLCQLFEARILFYIM